MPQVACQSLSHLKHCTFHFIIGLSIYSLLSSCYSKKTIKFTKNLKSWLNYKSACDHAVLYFFYLSDCCPKTYKDSNVKFKIIIVPVVFYGVETWLLILTEESTRLRMSEDIVIRIFGPKSKEVTG
jgi:hypothetical protein